MATTKLLVLGAPRSGTSLLAGMIGAHPDVAMLREDYSGALGKIVGKEVVANKLCLPNQIDLSHPWYNRILRRYGFTCFRGFSVVSVVEYMADPSMKVIGLVRSPYAVVDSMIRRGGLDRAGAYRRWAKGIEVLSDIVRRYGERVIVLSFEKIVTNPLEVMMLACDHLDIAYDDSMLMGYRHTSSYDNENSAINPAKATVSSDLIQRHPLHAEYPEAYERYCLLDKPRSANKSC
jgi:hypothetical protein